MIVFFVAMVVSVTCARLGLRPRLQTEGDAGAARADAHGRASVRLSRLSQTISPAVALGPASADTFG